MRSGSLAGYRSPYRISDDRWKHAVRHGAGEWLNDKNIFSPIAKGMPKMFLEVRTVDRAGTYNERNRWADWRYSQTFYYPQEAGYPLDWCKNWARNCGEPAASKWCKSKHYWFSRADGFTREVDVGLMWVVSDQRICHSDICDSFRAIECAH